MSKKKTHTSPKPSAAKPASKPVTSTEPWHLKYWFLLALGGLFVLVMVAFGGAFSHEFVSWDDHVYVYENPQILNPTAASFKAFGSLVVSLNYHPLTMWSLWLNSALFGTGA